VYVSVVKWPENQFRVGWYAFERAVKERLFQCEAKD